MAASETTTVKPARARSAARPARKRRGPGREARSALLLMSPWIIGFLLFFAYPLVATVWFSFTHYDQINPPTFVGLRNWRYVLGLSDFWQAMGNTIWLSVVMVSARVVSGLCLGVLVTEIKRGASALRAVLYLPYLAPPVAATIAFVFLLNPGTGPVNVILAKIGIHGPDWFNDPTWAKPALTLLAVWGIGDLMVIFLAALLDTPEEQYEAAHLDGAGRLARFWYVTIPHLRPVLIFAAITGVIEVLQYYTQAIVAAQVASGRAAAPGTDFDPGYPQGSTLTLPQMVWSLAFQHFDTGAACVIALVLFVFAMVFTSMLLRRESGFVDDGS